jgi:hypothetical protein
VLDDRAPERRTIIASALKTLLLPRSVRPRAIRFGVLRGTVAQIDTASNTQLWLGLWEREVQGWMRRFTANARTIIDAGAGKGAYTAYFLRGTRAAHVVAIEPDPAERRALRAALALNGISPDNPRLSIVELPVGATADGRTTTLDAIPIGEGPCFVKTDIEGAEAEALRGAPNLLARSNVSWLIETHALALEQRCIATLSATGYETRVIQPAWWRVLVPETRPAAHNRWLVAFRRC